MFTSLDRVIVGIDRFSLANAIMAVKLAEKSTSLQSLHDVTNRDLTVQTQLSAKRCSNGVALPVRRDLDASRKARPKNKVSKRHICLLPFFLENLRRIQT